jgi:hypothetical protein
MWIEGALILCHLFVVLVVVIVVIIAVVILFNLADMLLDILIGKIKKYRNTKHLKKINPFGLKVGDTVKIDRSCPHYSWLKEGVIEREYCGDDDAYVSGWYVNYKYLKPRTKIYMGGE